MEGREVYPGKTKVMRLPQEVPPPATDEKFLTFVRTDGRAEKRPAPLK